MTMLPIAINQVKPWFEAYGATLADRHSFRLMIDLAACDIRALELLMPEYRRHAPDLVPECEADLEAARTMVAQMEDRLRSMLEK